MSRLSLLLSLLSSVSAFAQSWPGDGLDPDASGPHFALEASAGPWNTPIVNDASRVLALRKSGSQLQLNRESVANTAPQPLATGFVFMPFGLKEPTSSRELVCWTKLTGAASSASAATVPDPRNGSEVACRLDAGGGAFGVAVSFTRALPSTRAIFLMKLEVSGGVFRVIYYEDELGTLVNQPANFSSRIFARTFNGTAFGRPTPASL